MGFTFDDTDAEGVRQSARVMDELIAKTRATPRRIFPYIGGEEVNDTRPTPTIATSSTSAT